MTILPPISNCLHITNFVYLIMMIKIIILSAFILLLPLKPLITQERRQIPSVVLPSPLQQLIQQLTQKETIEKSTPTVQLEKKEKRKQIIHLKYAKAKDMATMLQIMLPEITVYPHEELNALEIYDTSDIIKEAEELINLSDLPKRQVVIEMQAFELSRTKSIDIGFEITDWSINLKSILPPGALTKDNIGTVFPGSLSMKDLKTEIKILATPKVMISNRQQAQIHIGDKIPYEIASLGAGGHLVYTVQFVDVGIKLTVTPTIYINDEIDITISAEVSSVGKLTARGYPEIGTRKTETTIHLKDGYTAILGGLLKEETRKTLIGLPFLVRIPILGHLFGRTKHENIITEVRITMTPKILTQEFAVPEKELQPR